MPRFPFPRRMPTFSRYNPLHGVDTIPGSQPGTLSDRIRSAGIRSGPVGEGRRRRSPNTIKDSTHRLYAPTLRRDSEHQLYAQMSSRNHQIAADIADARNLLARADAISRALARARRFGNTSDKRACLGSAEWHIRRLQAELERLRVRLERRARRDHAPSTPVPSHQHHAQSRGTPAG